MFRKYHYDLKYIGIFYYAENQKFVDVLCWAVPCKNFFSNG